MRSERESRNSKKKKMIKMKERKHTKELTKLNGVLNQTEEESKSKPMEKKRKREKKRNHNAGREIQISDEGMSNVKEETGKSRSVDKKKRKREKEINLHCETEIRISNEDKSETTKKKKLSQKKRKSQKKNDSQIDNENKAEDVAQEQNDLLIGKSKGTKKKRKKVHTTDTRNKGDLSQNEIDVAHKEDDVYHISSGDTDASAGMKKWLMEYHQSRQPVAIMQKKVDDFIISHDARLKQEKKEREAQSAEEGWTLVEHHKGRKKTTESATGTTVGSAARAAIEDKMTKKKNNDFSLDFYRFQKRDERRNEILNLQSKFEEDKKRIQQLRAARKFRPY